MAFKNPKVDAYIDKSADFAKPILKHFRKVIHEACPEVTETIKWGMPSFDYHGILCGFAAFKNHCSLGFWKAGLMKDAAFLQSEEAKGSMGNIGKIHSIKELPSDKQLIKWIREAMKLNEQGIKKTKEASKHPRIEITTPDWLIAAIRKNKKAWSVFDKFSPSHKKDYVEWITEAKTEETREKRLLQALEWMAEGKPRNWKYMKEYR
jgi:uncharacterized protein YdeI (YjbR/CyaY-like superfamily)